MKSPILTRPEVQNRSAVINGASPFVAVEQDLAVFHLHFGNHRRLPTDIPAQSVLRGERAARDPLTSVMSMLVSQPLEGPPGAPKSHRRQSRRALRFLAAVCMLSAGLCSQRIKTRKNHSCCVRFDDAKGKAPPPISVLAIATRATTPDGVSDPVKSRR